MRAVLLGFTVLFAFALLIGESVVLVLTDKFWPLSVDDYVAVVALLVSARLARDPRRLGFLMASWAYVLGNLYSMLFNRLDPVSGTGQRVPLLAALVLIALVCFVASARLFVDQARERGSSASQTLAREP